MNRFVRLGCLIALALGCTTNTETGFSQDITLDMFGEGTGSGRITGTITANLSVNCRILNGSDADADECEKTFADPDEGVVVLTATPDAGHQFQNWACSTSDVNANCSGCQAGGACTVRWSFGDGVTFEISARFNPPGTSPNP